MDNLPTKEIIVQKFGGSSLANHALIKNIASSIAKKRDKYFPVIVVSAMYGKTSKLLANCFDFVDFQDVNNIREVNSVIATGEVVTAGLLALALHSLGINAKSFQAWQLPILTNSNYLNNQIISINTGPIYDCLNNNVVPIICGFQGINENMETTTLGRGGSDTTAVALAVSIKANRCEIYTDVNGIYSTDPRILHNAKHLKLISNDIMQEMAIFGANVLEARASMLSKKYKMPLLIANSFSDAEGTMVLDESKLDNMESSKIISINVKNDVAAVRLSDNCNLSQILNIVQVFQQKGLSCSSAEFDLNLKSYGFNIPLIQVQKLIDLFNQQFSHLKYKIDQDISYLSLVGYHLSDNVDLLEKILVILNKHDSKVYNIKVFHNRITLCLHSFNTSKLVVDLHNSLIVN